jgi:hypothetical protein
MWPSVRCAAAGGAAGTRAGSVVSGQTGARRTVGGSGQTVLSGTGTQPIGAGVGAGTGSGAPAILPPSMPGYGVGHDRLLSAPL